MFTSVLRRWKLAAPLALALLAVVVVSAGALSSASASSVKFHFFGRATVLEDNSLIFKDWQCDTGPLARSGGSLDTGHCNAVFGGNTTVGQNEFHVVVSTVFAEGTVKSDHGKTEGHTIATTDAEGLVVSIAFTKEDGADNDTGADTDTTSTFDLLTSAQITNTAEAECQQKSHHSHSSARALTNVVFNDLKILEGNSGTTTTDSAGNTLTVPTVHLTPSGAADESFPLFVIPLNSTSIGPVAAQLTVNEQQVFHSGGISFIKASALHLIVTDAAGTVFLDLIVDHDFAGIHCAKHLPSDDSVGA